MGDLEIKPLNVHINGKIKNVSVLELALIGRACILETSNNKVINKEFIKKLLQTSILIFTNPANVDFTTED